MTIHVKQHYRNVGGKLVLVHEHEHKGDAAYHEQHHHEVAVDDEFKKLFGHHETASAATEPDVDAEFEKLFDGDADSEFEKLFGEGSGADSGASEEPSLEQIKAVGNEWKSDDGSKHRFYFNGLAKWNGGGYDGMDKGAKLWIDAKTGEWGSKNIQPETLEKIKAAIKKEALVNATVSAPALEQPTPTPVDEPKVGSTSVKFDQLKPGMVFVHNSSDIGYLSWKVTDISDVVVSMIAHNTESDSDTLVAAGEDKWNKAFKDSLKLASKDVDIGPKVGEKAPAGHERVDNGAKIGDTPKWDQLEAGMVLKDKNGAQMLIVDDETSPMIVQLSGGTLITLSSEDYKSITKGASDMTLVSKNPEDFKNGTLDSGLHVGDTKTIYGKTYVLNANHRWELVDEAQAAGSDLLDQIQSINKGASITVNGVMVKKSSYSNNLIVAKNDENGKPLPKKVKDALKEMHPAGYKLKQKYFLIAPDKIAEFTQVMEAQQKGTLKGKPAPKKEAAPKVAPVAMPQGFPFKKIGEQKGSNPGGLYEDKFGKKWYIKFPQSEDHVKNELLASKLYTMAGITAPKLKIVNDGGKVGIASAFVEGLTNDGAALKAGAPGAKEGFGVDAWLANWDSAGLSFDNMPVDKDGKAVRIDVGGSLLFRAQGGPKGDAFGNTVSEIDTLRDAKMNPQTASIFGGMSPDELNKSIAGVLVIPDEAIEAAVMKWGPGDDAAKKELAKKLIARKQYLAKRFPEADAIANPPAPNPRRLPIDESKLPPKVDFFNYNGTGKGLSSKEWKNKANQKAFDDLYAAAMKGNLIDFKSYEYMAINPETGEELGLKKIAEGHPNKDIATFYATAVSYMETIAYPSNKKVEGWLPEDVEDIGGMSDAFPAEPFGVTVGDVSHEKRLGFWISLGEVSEPQAFAPPQVQDVTPAMKAQGKADYAKMPQALKSWLSSVQGSGSANIGDNKKSEKDKQIAKMAYEHATEFPEGTRLRRWLHMPSAMQALLSTAKEGHVFENPRSACTSMNHSWETSGTHFGNVMLEIIHAKGAKGLATFASGSFQSEQEITSLPGQRYMILGKGKTVNGHPKYTVLALPPDPTYVESLGL